MGFREDGPSDETRVPTEAGGAPSSAAAAVPTDGYVPLSYRVSRFFDVMTSELVHLQHNLEREVEAKTRENENLMLHVMWS